MICDNTVLLCSPWIARSRGWTADLAIPPEQNGAATLKGETTKGLKVSLVWLITVEITSNLVTQTIYLVEGRLFGYTLFHPLRAARVETAATFNMGPQLFIVR